VEQNAWLVVGDIFPNMKGNHFKGLMVLEVVGNGKIAVAGMAYNRDNLSTIPVIDLTDSD
jgi:hypothetical protein